MKSLMTLITFLFKKLGFNFSVDLPTFSSPKVPNGMPVEKHLLNTLPGASGKPPTPYVKDVTVTPIPRYTTPAPMTPVDFIKTFLPVATLVETSHGIKPLIAITQAAHESNWGRSELSTEGLNLFGMAAGSWMTEKKPVIWFPTYEESDFDPEKIRYWEYADDIVKKTPRPGGGSLLVVNRPFRKYASWLFSTQDWANRISTTDRYRTVYACARKGDLADFALAIKKSGYATATDYGERINHVGNMVREILEKFPNA